MTATYRAPPSSEESTGAADASKMTGAVLSYADRQAYVAGLDGLLPRKPMLTMQQEFARSDAWVDWKGAHYTVRQEWDAHAHETCTCTFHMKHAHAHAHETCTCTCQVRQEWAYVTGRAHTRERCTPGTRDATHDGKTVEQFVSEVNGFIHERREKGHGTLLPEASAFLTTDEVLAVRLYSGPAYQPINTFLRQIASLNADFRSRVARDPALTFAATCRHIAAAIRKLAAVATPEELVAPLYRGLRGSLKKGFWIRDEMGMVVACDTAFMSTSRNRQTPIHYMGPGDNVLWELRTKPESDAGFHRGADISMLSQFAGEDEVLFPPCTMLTVRHADEASAASTVRKASLAEREDLLLPEVHTLQVELRAEQGKQFLCVGVQPSFV